MATISISTDLGVTLLTQFLSPQDMQVNADQAKYNTLISGLHVSTCLLVAAVVVVFFSSYWAVIIGALGYLLRSIVLEELATNSKYTIRPQPEDWLKIFGHVMWKYKFPIVGAVVPAGAQHEPTWAEWLWTNIGGFLQNRPV